MEMVNGYVFLDLTKSNVYAKALKVLSADKPVVIKDGSGAPYFVDSLTLDGTNVVITKGGKTITIANTNTITSTGDVLTIMDNIVDSKGNKRFVEGEGIETALPEGLTLTYNKWSLSGTHLMMVIAGNALNATEVAPNAFFIDFEVPSYVFDKVDTVFGSNIVTSSITLYGDDYSQQNLSCRLVKRTDNVLRIMNANSSTLTLTTDRSFRLQLDLLIDADYSE